MVSSIYPSVEKGKKGVAEVMPAAVRLLGGDGSVCMCVYVCVCVVGHFPLYVVLCLSLSFSLSLLYLVI